MILSEAPYALSEAKIRDTLPSVQSWLTDSTESGDLRPFIARSMAARLREEYRE